MSYIAEKKINNKWVTIDEHSELGVITEKLAQQIANALTIKERIPTRVTLNGELLWESLIK